MAEDVSKELKDAVDRVLTSKARKKLVVAGPGAGKTTLFRKLLESAGGTADQQLVLTFISNLKADLEGSLGDIADVYTLHGYCQNLLHGSADLRDGLSKDFRCYPGLVSLVKKDWLWLEESSAPEFVRLMRDLSLSREQETFYLDRANYYDAVDFDDSVYRTRKPLVADASLIPEYELVLIDEFQDFNKMEAAVIDLLAEKSSIVVAGDDDQALYSQLRGASWDHIRARYASGNYEIFELPFCMRCPQVIVDAVNDVISSARKAKKLNGRIEKPYRFFEPVKGEDSRRYPHIELVETSVQRANANYMGRYVEERIKAISKEDIALAKEKGEPVALVIGSNPYRRQVEDHLVSVGLAQPKPDDEVSARVQAFQILKDDAQSNLAWRIILEEGDERVAKQAVIAAAEKAVGLVEVIPVSLRDSILKEAEALVVEKGQDDTEGDDGVNIKVTSFEGCKGMSAQHVFLLGLQSGDMPKNAADVQDIEICRFLVGMTRTKKKCYVLTTGRFGRDFKKPSEFLAWIQTERFEKKKIDSSYWR